MKKEIKKAIPTIEAIVCLSLSFIKIVAKAPITAMMKEAIEVIHLRQSRRLEKYEPLKAVVKLGAISKMAAICLIIAVQNKLISG
jgi:hypothetical protein